MDHRGTTLLAALALLLILAPTAAAVRNDAAPVSAELAVPADLARLGEDFFVVSGAMEATGDTQGPVFVLDDKGSRFHVPLLRLYDMADKTSLATQDPEIEVFNATLEPSTGADFVWAAHNITVDATPGFTTGFFFDLLTHIDQDLFTYTGQQAPYPPTLVAMMDDDAWTVSQRDTNRSFFLPLGASTFVIKDADGNVVEPPSTATTPQWLVTMRGAQGPDATLVRTTAELKALGAAIPVEQQTHLSFTRASEGDFTESFSVDGFARFIEDFLGLRASTPDLPAPPSEDEQDLAKKCAEERTPSEECRAYYEEHKDEFQDPRQLDALALDLQQDAEQPDDNGTAFEQDNGTAPPETGEEGGETAAAVREALGVFEDLGGFANGALVGRMTGTIQYEGGAFARPGLTVMRFTGLSFEVLPPDRMAMDGEAVFVYTQGELPSDTSGVALGPLFLPFWAIALWIVAIGALLATKYYSLRDRDDPLTHKLTIPAIATHIVLVVIAFILFDLEFRYLFGTSLLSSVGVLVAPTWVAASSTVGPLTLASAQFGLWGFAWVLFGLPVKFIGRSILVMCGLMKPTWHFAAGLAALATWFFGATTILPLLGTALAAFL